ncbi:unnamed protein product [Menidia menidia]|uniref:(Atlantic silverside) hypothetical protein n=1 Tax=Menidia menidia TaxID=238744 RepID=A0A8S4BVF3_9TELE|nr:unnamed protein product [Menidia menidia]
MESNCKSQNLLCLMVPLVLAVNLPTGSPTQAEYNGEFGGYVTFHCPVKENRRVKLLYFQRGDIFINGYHATKEIHDTWQNTKFDLKTSTIQMFDLNVSHSGPFQCKIMYSDYESPEDFEIYLKVTANYSKPSVERICEEKNNVMGCHVTCSSHDGYPRKEIQWKDHQTLNDSHQIVTIRESSDANATTKLFNISSTAYFNCSSGEQKLSCSVGDITSDIFKVCAPTIPPDYVNLYVILALAVIVLLGIVLIVYITISQLKKMRVSAPKEDTENVNELERLQT